LERLDPPPDIFLLDDGFSHVRLHRDLDLLAFPAANPFAGGRLPPGGRLREPLASVRVADAVLLTGGERGAGLGTQLARTLRPHGFGGPGFVSETIAGEPLLVPTGTPLAPCRILAVSAIARPRAFLETLRRQGFEIAEHLAFDDHHRYPEPSLEKILRAYTKSGAQAVLTTGKDMVKLRGRLELPLAELPIHARPEEDFFHWLDARLAELKANPKATA
jgi:tetraacyldisaccharide 4'-kinase